MNICNWSKTCSISWTLYQIIIADSRIIVYLLLYKAQAIYCCYSLCIHCRSVTNDQYEVRTMQQVSKNRNFNTWILEKLASSEKDRRKVLFFFIINQSLFIGPRLRNLTLSFMLWESNFYNKLRVNYVWMLYCLQCISRYYFIYYSGILFHQRTEFVAS